MAFSDPLRLRALVVAVGALAGCAPLSHLSPVPGDAAQSAARRAAAHSALLLRGGVPFVGTPAALAAYALRPPKLNPSVVTALAPATKAKKWAPSVFVSDVSASTVYQFAAKKNGKVINKITDVSSPQGLDADTNGNLWVASTGDSTLREYPPSTYKAATVLSDPDEFPVSVAVCPNGTVYAFNAYDYSYLPGNIEIYAAGSTSPTGVVPDANIYSARFGTCDSTNTLYYDYLDINYDAAVASYNGSQVTEYGNLGIGFPGGMRAYDNGTTLGITDQYAGVELFTKSNLAAGPYLTLKGIGDPVSFSTIKPQTNVWIADASKLDAVLVTPKDKQSAIVGAGTLVLPVDAYIFLTGNL